MVVDVLHEADDIVAGKVRPCCVSCAQGPFEVVDKTESERV